ncbi:MAG: hypothetical protein IJP65_03095, partial [Bacteroidales bacterium]|nr:hypothetical protein [Bacteroidales bacterium]
SNGNGYLSEKQINNHFFCQKNIEMECRKQLCEKCKKKEDDYFLVTLFCQHPVVHHSASDARNVISNKIQINNMDFFIKIWIGNLDFLYFCKRIKNKSYGIKGTFTASVI